MSLTTPPLRPARGRIALPLHVSLAALALFVSLRPGFAAAQTPDEPAAKPPAVDTPAKDGEKPPVKQPQRFVRVRQDAQKQLLALETAIATYEPAPGSKYAGQPIRVELVGAIHIGEREYYQRLNRRFQKYDALLYELVAPEGTQIPKGGGEGSGSPVSMLQVGMKDLLKLEFQLEQIDYTRDNFVHADMTPEEFAKSMKDRGESVLQMAFRAFGRSLAAQSKKGGATEFSMLVALMSRDRDRKLKRLLAQQMEDVEDLTEALAGKDGSSTLIGERNRKALEVMERELKSGRRNIGIFYGAGHLADMERRLLGEYGLRRIDLQWEEAWDLK